MTKKKEEKVETTKEEEKDKNYGLDFGKLLNDPVVASLLESGKDIFKKEKQDPNICEINIKAPSEVVLKLFNISK